MRKSLPLALIVDRAHADQFGGLVQGSAGPTTAFNEWRYLTGAPWLVIWQDRTRARKALPADEAQLRTTLRLCAADLADCEFQWLLYVEDFPALQAMVQEATTQLMTVGNA